MSMNFCKQRMFSSFYNVSSLDYLISKLHRIGIKISQRATKLLYNLSEFGFLTEK